MEDGLREPTMNGLNFVRPDVLILVLVEDGLRDFILGEEL